MEKTVLERAYWVHSRNPRRSSLANDRSPLWYRSHRRVCLQQRLYSIRMSEKEASEAEVVHCVRQSRSLMCPFRVGPCLTSVTLTYAYGRRPPSCRSVFSVQEVFPCSLHRSCYRTLPACSCFPAHIPLFAIELTPRPGRTSLLLRAPNRSHCQSQVI